MNENKMDHQCYSHEMGTVWSPIRFILCSHFNCFASQFSPIGVLKTTETKDNPFLKIKPLMENFKT